MKYEFIEKKGKFRVHKPESASYLYLPLANEAGVMSSITPDGHGDNKISQEQFLMEPMSVEGLHESMSSRNFWCDIKGEGPWSAAGFSAKQQAMRFQGQEEACVMEAGLLWQEVCRIHRESGLEAKVLNFCPAGAEKAEVMQVTLTNQGNEKLSFCPTAAIPLYARGADHLRDHRHVTALLNRITVEKDGVTVTPAMTFDERGHNLNEESYGVYGRDNLGNGPLGVFPTVEAFVGEGGSLLCPQGALEQRSSGFCRAGKEVGGYEAMGALRFPECTLQPGEARIYTIVLSYNREGKRYLDAEEVKKALSETEEYWEKQKVISCDTGNPDFDCWMEWVSVQPAFRKLYGCSFLPYHDYGRGGRGWRDLWQDCLALLLRNPAQVRGDLLSFFAGVRMDGSNATIIGKQPGEFRADRNNIVRVWMDHGYWPMFTVRLYLDQTGDYEFLLEESPYFKDSQICRGGASDTEFRAGERPVMRQADGADYKGTVLEHLLIQQVTQFYDVGEHGHMRLRGADWNDALDMAEERGESVAFTAAYAGNLRTFSALLLKLEEKTGVKEVLLAEELELLLASAPQQLENPQKKQELLMQYCRVCGGKVSGQKIKMPVRQLAGLLDEMGCWIQNHIRRKEVVDDGRGHFWINGYYDNHGRKAEGMTENGVRMMLTGQVFSILSGTATDRQVEEIIKAADRYLYTPEAGGYRLNTDFKEVKMDMGRMFGFAYGHKENGAVFCHMAVMYAYALYSRGFVREGYRVIRALFEQCMNTESSRMFPGIPEYFGPDGRGMYPYLTGAGSWLVLTVQTQMYGVNGAEGDLVLTPKLQLSQFDENGEAAIRCSFRGRVLRLVYQNRYRREIGDYELTEVTAGGQQFWGNGNLCRIPGTFFEEYPDGAVIQITGILE